MRNNPLLKIYLLVALLTHAWILPAQLPKSNSAQKLEQMGFLNLMELDSTFILDIKYTTADNFTGKILYTELKEAYLHPLAANALVKAHHFLKQIKPTYRIKIFDATRPLSAQQVMWDMVKNTPMKDYVSNPANGGGLHNYGLAVDITVVDENGNDLPMGSSFDHLGKESHIDREEEMVALGTISEEERQNRILLREAMEKAGYKALKSEWWHFNFKSRKEAREGFKIVP
ncbi:MAG: M15 family metallopeptidase [Phocaeicola sp.]